MIQTQRQNPDQRFRPLSPEAEEKLLFSKRAAETLERRDVKCPQCGFRVLEVYGRDHHITRVKCQKCKFNDIIDTALFRTVKVRRHNQVPRRQRRKALR